MKWVGLGSIVLLITVVTWVIVRGGLQLPDEPQPIAWDRAPCAHCHMGVGAPRHAAQLITAQGEVLNFDDPGCAFDYLEQHKPEVHRLFFHAEGDQWIAEDQVAFVPADETPMGSLIQAVPKSTPGAISLEAARRAHLDRAKAPGHNHAAHDHAAHDHAAHDHAAHDHAAHDHAAHDHAAPAEATP